MKRRQRQRGEQDDFGRMAASDRRLQRRRCCVILPGGPARRRAGGAGGHVEQEGIVVKFLVAAGLAEIVFGAMAIAGGPTVTQQIFGAVLAAAGGLMLGLAALLAKAERGVELLGELARMIARPPQRPEAHHPQARQAPAPAALRGRVQGGTLVCDNCGEPNALTALMCTRCGLGGK